jgi:hypothetical protein
MYTHARQFPHLAGKTDDEIRSLVRNALTSRPNLLRIMRIRNRAVLGGMLVGAIALKELASLELGTALMIVGGTATAFLICWNLAWVNTVLFRITQPKPEQPGS